MMPITIEVLNLSSIEMAERATVIGFVKYNPIYISFYLPILKLKRILQLTY